MEFPEAKQSKCICSRIHVLLLLLLLLVLVLRLLRELNFRCATRSYERNVVVSAAVNLLGAALTFAQLL